MNVELAKTAGFCFGVKRAVDTVYQQIEQYRGEKIFTYGPIIHNEEVIKDLRSHGVEVLNDEEELKSGRCGCGSDTVSWCGKIYLRYHGRTWNHLCGCNVSFREEDS